MKKTVAAQGDPLPAPADHNIPNFHDFWKFREKYPSGRKTPPPVWICDMFLIDLLGCRGGLFNISLQSRKELPTQYSQVCWEYVCLIIRSLTETETDALLLRSLEVLIE